MMVMMLTCVIVVMMMLVIMWMVMHFRPIPVQIRRHIVIMVLMLCIQNHIEIAGIQPRLFSLL